MASIERFIDDSRTFYSKVGSCPSAESRWGMGLLTAYKQHETIPHELAQIQLPDGNFETGVVIQKPYANEHSDATWLALTGPCAGFILSRWEKQSLRPLRNVLNDFSGGDGFILMDTLQNELKQENILTEGPGWYLSFVINLLRKTVEIPPDADVMWNNSLEFQKLESDWLIMLQHG
jgi:hypothetical protein